MKTTCIRISFIGFIAAATMLGLTAASPLRASAQTQTEVKTQIKENQYLYISGQVNVPQRCIYTNGVTLGTAIKMAKGVTTQAAPTKVTVTRGEKAMTLNLKAIEQGKAKDIELQPGDRVHVPKQ